MIKTSARIAIGFGIFLAIAEVVRNWGDWQWWPWWVVDYIAVALLLYGGRVALRSRSAAPLCAGWGFTCAMFWMSFFSHLESLHEKGTGPIESHTLTAVIGVLFAITIIGLALALVGSQRERVRA